MYEPEKPEKWSINALGSAPTLYLIEDSVREIAVETGKRPSRAAINQKTMEAFTTALSQYHGVNVTSVEDLDTRYGHIKIDVHPSIPDGMVIIFDNGVVVGSIENIGSAAPEEEAGDATWEPDGGIPPTFPPSATETDAYPSGGWREGSRPDWAGEPWDGDSTPTGEH